MSWDTLSVPELYTAVHWTARTSGVLFALALLAPTLARRHSLIPYVGFILAHTIHFGFVIWLAVVTGGARMFPGGRDIADVGGWPTVFGVFSFFYVLASVGLLARLRGRDAGRGLRLGGRFATTFLGYMFVSTYVPLMTRSPWFAAPAAVIAIAVFADLLGERLRRISCIGRASPSA